MKKIVFIFLLTLLLSPGVSCAQGLGQYHSLSLVVSDTLPRAYWLYEPPGYTPGEEWPVVFAFHGFGQLPLDLADWMEIYKVADTAKFFIVYPVGLAVYSPYSNQTLIGWNVPGVYIAPHDDVEFVNQMIDDIIAHPDFAIDTNRVFSTGLSMGGELTYYLACNLSERIASFAGVSAQMMYVVMDSCTPDRIISLYHNLGTEDEAWPPGGGPGFPPLEGTAEYWAGIANCSLEPTVTYLPDTYPGDNCTVTLLTYDSCYTGYEVVCYRIEGGIHTWPGGGVWGDGVNHDIHTSSEIWKFFRRNPHPRTYSYCFPEGVTFISQEEIDNFPLENPNCTEIQGNVLINGNDITDLSGLNTITSVGGSLSIFGNDDLASLSGLDNLQSIGGDLEIGKDMSPWGVIGNSLLTSLSGLENIEYSSIGNLTIISNPLLSDCDIENICAYLLNPNGILEIHDNDSGCNDSLEIRNACEGVIINELYEINNISLSPNPFTSSTTLSYTLNEPENIRFTVYNVQSQIVYRMQERQEKGEQRMLWNAEGLPAGIYYFRIQAGKMAGGGKIIKISDI